MSRLLDRSPHVLHVQNRTRVRDASGVRIYEPVGDRIPVKGLVEPVREWSSAEENQSLGLQVTDMLVIRVRSWPGDIHSHVIYEGDVYETVGAPQKFGLSRKTTHWRVTVKWIGKDGEAP